MRDPSQIRIIITTAGFGEGHNSAAKHLAIALEPHAEVELIDPCDRGAPWLNHQLRQLYRLVTTYMPKTWARIYRSTERHDFSKKRFPFMRKPERALHEILLSFEPSAVVSTYPLYPYFIERSFRSSAQRVPVFTVITDSIEINASWRNAPTDFWMVTDSLTKQKMVDLGLDENKIIITGFPVHPRFQQLSPLTAESPISPFKVLFFPTAKKPVVRRILRAILASDASDIEVTVVLGRNTRKLYERAREIQLAHPGKVHIKGWTRRVPELLASHHLAIGKAGGATVHEAIAAHCPMLINHLVPGQEEGNLALLQHIGTGSLAETPEAVTDAINQMLKDNAAGWRTMKQAYESTPTPCGARTASQFILNHIQSIEP